MQHDGKSRKDKPRVTRGSQELGVTVAKAKLRKLEAFRNAAKQGTTVTRMRLCLAQIDIEDLFDELLGISLSNKGGLEQEIANG